LLIYILRKQISLACLETRVEGRRISTRTNDCFKSAIILVWNIARRFACFKHIDILGKNYKQELLLVLRKLLFLLRKILLILSKINSW
jgi:hypothetical protein